MSLPLGHLPDTRYPDPRIEPLDKRFIYRQGNAAIERIATGFRWAEGPVYFRDGGYLIFSDIPNNRMLRWLEEDGHLSVFRAPSNYANGNTRDREGRLITCEHDTRRVTRTELDGRITVLIDRYRRQATECAERRGGGEATARSGSPIPATASTVRTKATRRTPNCRATSIGWIRTPARASVVADDFVRPNGLCFSPDERLLYVVDSGISHGGPAHIRVFSVDGARLSNGRVFADDFAPGMTDGLRTDTDGNVWCSMGWADPAEDGVRCYAADGDLIGRVRLPEGCANLCFGGRKKDRLFMCASTSVYALYLNARGASAPVDRNWAASRNVTSQSRRKSRLPAHDKSLIEMEAV